MSLFRREFNSTFDYYKTQDEVCGTCKYNKRDWTNPNNPDFYCSNERSNYYGDNTEYKTTCEEWEGKEQQMIKEPMFISPRTFRGYEQYKTDCARASGWNEAMAFIFAEELETERTRTIREKFFVVENMQTEREGE